MDVQLLVLCGLTFVIYLIGALAYAARIAGVRTRKIAVSFALFNVLVLVSRAANSFQGPFLSKRIELNLHLQHSGTASHPIHLRETGEFLPFTIEQATCAGNLAKGRGRLCHFHFVRRHHGINGGFVGIAIGIARLLRWTRQTERELL